MGRLPLALAAVLALAGCAAPDEPPTPPPSATPTATPTEASPTPTTPTAPPTAPPTPPSPPPPPPSAPTPPATPAAPTAQRFTDEFDVTLTASGSCPPSSCSTPGGATPPDRNCVRLDHEGAISLTGTATATWTAQSPTSASLALAVSGPDGVARKEGASPLTVAFSGTADEAGALTFAIQAASTPTVAAQQAVTIAIDFTHSGAALGEPAFSTCVLVGGG